ncbi:hypothetical protein Patl1_36276 [Pistacia atlantica]|nr:hypothetical protein Patl1_36276 [Pistacia atlantica]
MGTFVGHLVPGLALTVLGLWHTINTIRAYCLKGSNNFKLDNFEHATMFLHLAIFAGFTLCADITNSSDILSGVPGMLVASVFAISATSFPNNFLAALVVSISVVFQGCWFVNMGFNLWSPEFVPQGCSMQLAEEVSSNMHGAVICASHEADFRARGLANLQFSWVLSGILVFTGSVCLILARKYAPRCQSTQYEQLHSTVIDVSIAADGLKLVHP